MRIIYDSVTDSLYMDLAGGAVAHTNEIAGDTIEADDSWRMVAVTISNARSRVDLQNISIEGLS